MNLENMVDGPWPEQGMQDHVPPRRDIGIVLAINNIEIQNNNSIIVPTTWRELQDTAGHLRPITEFQLNDILMNELSARSYITDLRPVRRQVSWGDTVADKQLDRLRRIPA